MDKLVAYFSASGVTQKVAEKLAKAANADLFCIEPKQPYSNADLNWNNPNSRSSVEMKKADSRPEIASSVKDMEKYKVVFIGFPIWWYVEPKIIDTFLESYDFSGKTVIPFATSGGSGFGKAEDQMKGLCTKNTIWKAGKMLNGAQSDVALSSWINSLNI